jgi:hypothetical protein
MVDVVLVDDVLVEVELEVDVDDELDVVSTRVVVVVVVAIVSPTDPVVALLCWSLHALADSTIAQIPTTARLRDDLMAEVCQQDGGSADQGVGFVATFNKL